MFRGRLARACALKHAEFSFITRNAIVHYGRLDERINMISKPFSFEELASKVRQVLDAAG
jgi:hypothetical protein